MEDKEPQSPIDEHLIGLCLEQLKPWSSQALGWSDAKLKEFLGRIATGFVGSALLPEDLGVLLREVHPRLRALAEKGEGKTKGKRKPKTKEVVTPPPTKLPPLDGGFNDLLEPGDAEYAAKLYESICEDHDLRSVSDTQAAKDIVLVRVQLRKALLERYTAHAAKRGVKEPTEQIAALTARLIPLEKAFAVTREQRQKSDVQSQDVAELVMEFQRKAARYREENPDVFLTWCCPECGCVNHTDLPHPMFEKGHLWNDPLARLVEQGALSAEDAAKVLGWSHIEKESKVTSRGFLDLMKHRGYKTPGG